MKYNQLTGDSGNGLDFMEAAQAGKEILRLARVWREKLGTKCSLLDEYLRGILQAMSEATNTFDTSQQGFEGALSDLRGILRRIKEGKEDKARKHPFYPKVRAYMAAHPFPQDGLYYETYCVGLFAEYITFATKRFLDECETRFQAALERANVPQMREALISSNADITAEELDSLELLIGQLFVLIAPSSVFMQGMIDQVILSLLSQNKQSREYVFQRLLDDMAWEA